MRTFPKCLAAFREIVDERGAQLRKLSFEELRQLPAPSTEHVTVESRPATISIHIQPRPAGGLRVVVQGFLKARFVPGKHVALDGFYKYPDGRVAAMPDEEFYEFE